MTTVTQNDKVITSEKALELNQIVKDSELAKKREEYIALLQDTGDDVQIIDNELVVVRELNDPWFLLKDMGSDLPSFDDGEENGFSIYLRFFTPEDGEEGQEPRHFVIADLYRSGVKAGVIRFNVDENTEDIRSSIGEFHIAGDSFVAKDAEEKTGLPLVLKYPESGIYLSRFFRKYIIERLRPWFINAGGDEGGFLKAKAILTFFEKV